MSIPLRAFITSLIIWGLVAVTLMLTTLQQAAQQKDAYTVAQIVVRTIIPFTPMLLLSWGLGILCAKSPELWLQPRNIIYLLLFFLVIVLPLFVVWDLMVALINTNQPLTDFGKQLSQLPPMWIWIDLLLMIITLSVQLTITAFQANQRRTQSLLKSEQDNIRLKLERLQGQLEPHFLFNALNTISALVRSADRNTAVTALARLSDLLRYALRASKNNWLSVQDEINFLQDYLALQGLRFADRLIVELDIQPEQWDALSCPPLLLQPVIENAIRHGLESHEGLCTLQVKITLQDDHIVFVVSNPVPADAKRQAGHGVGLHATRERLRLLFSDRASLVTQELNQQFIASLCIPTRDPH